MRRRSHAGFTLVEVMAALTIMSLVMIALYTALNTTLKVRDQLENESKVARLGPSILDLIEGDLRRIWVMNIEDDRVFKGEARSIDGESADSLSFITTVDSVTSRRIGEVEVTSDLSETGYKLRRNPVLPDVMELWRRQSFHVDESPLEDGEYELVHDRVVSFQVRYLEEIDRYAEAYSDWDASEQHRLPALVDIELAIEAVPRTADDLDRRGAESRTLRYRRVIPLGRETDILMRVHALPPSFVGAGAGDTLGGPGGPGSGQGGPDGKGGDGGSDSQTGTNDDFQDFLDDMLDGGGG
jgi:prepilin-type N-terminal cleavage/methylation domain-containing protein